MSSTARRRKRQQVASKVHAAYTQAGGNAYATGGDDQAVAHAAVMAAIGELGKHARHTCEDWRRTVEDCPSCYLARIGVDLGVIGAQA